MGICLSDFQDQFKNALYGQSVDAATAVAALSSQPGFAVYRNTVLKGCIDALQANFPSITRLVGEEWFRAAAAIYVHRHPPEDSRMLFYGDEFAEFLAQFEPAAELTYLPDVARVDRLWTESHVAMDHATLNPASIAHLTPEALTDVVLHPHPSARWAWFCAAPIYTIWIRNRYGTEDGEELEWHGEGILLARPSGAVESTPLNEAGCAFLDACSAGLPLGKAVDAALARQESTDLSELIATLIGAGAFSRASQLSID
jgi:hypothetical protein